MTLEEQIIARARAIAVAETGGDAPEAVIRVLARMAAATSEGVCAGFLRLPPGKAVELKMDDQKPL